MADPADRWCEMAEMAYPSDSPALAPERELATDDGPRRRRERTTVLVADDHPIYRQGLARSIKQRAELDLISVADDGRTALDQIKALEPDVAVLDVRMPGLDGLAIARALASAAGQTRLVLITGHGTDVAFEALGAGVAALLSKTASPDSICDTIAAVARGGAYVGPEFHESLARELSSRQDDPGPILSPREREVLELAAEGLAVSDIGKRLHLGAATVKTHLQHVYRKLEVSDRSAAVAVALRRGLIS
jgi:two-component system nitrate/nitrite response regulator NarL